KNRISTSQSKIPVEMWVLLIGGGAVMLLLTYMFGTPDLLLQACGIALAAALLAFVLFLIFELQHPFVGALSVPPDPYVHVLDAWAHPSQQ
ncbi:MAG: DUF4239 domain-containing protein, partial [Mycolicibacterium sp.]|nr:DUF4239 domain-containing protein [Mycolicibacterium sp.]